MAPQRAERALTEQRWDDASRFGAGRPRSPSRGYLEIPSSAPKTPTQGACSITIERGRRLALGTALLHWPVLPRPQLAGFQVSTEAGLVMLVVAVVVIGNAVDGGARLPLHDVFAAARTK